MYTDQGKSSVAFFVILCSLLHFKKKELLVTFLNCPQTTLTQPKPMRTKLTTFLLNYSVYKTKVINSPDQWLVSTTLATTIAQIFSILQIPYVIYIIQAKTPNLHHLVMTIHSQSEVR